MRKLDSGGPMLVIIFCAFMLIAATVLFMVQDAEPPLPYTLAGISTFTLIVFSIRMQTGYFDYVRKIRAICKEQGSTGTVPILLIAAACQFLIFMLLNFL